MRLATAIRSGDTELTSKMINQLSRSKIAREWAVYRTISSQGSRTKGLRDKKRPVTNTDYQRLSNQLWQIVKDPNKYRATPLKRIYLDKPNNRGKRPISIPSYEDRAIQHLYNTILSVFHEEIAEPNSFGFRPFRSPGWAAKSVTLAFWSRKSFGHPRYCIELDIAKCFDTISHSFMMEKVAKVTIKQNTYQVIPDSVMEQWLKSGYVDIKGELTPKEQVVPTLVGVPQPISPTISNIVLNGIEKGQCS